MVLPAASVTRLAQVRSRRSTVGPDDVRRIATEGFPLWEPIDVMVERNRRITLGYSHLSQRLADVIADGDEVRDANWCTFATWSSRTIGSWIEGITYPEPHAAGGGGGEGGRVAGIPRTPETWRPLRPHRLVRQAIARGTAASFRALAAGNRVVFLEVGLSIAAFLDHFPDRAMAQRSDADQRWEDCWRAVQAETDQLAALDPSWMLTPTPPPAELRLGLRQYFEALRATDPMVRAQHVLAGNIFIAAYEQRRVDGYVWAALALFSGHAMRRLVRDRTGAVGGVRRWPSSLFARLMTRRLTLQLGDEPVLVGRPIARLPATEAGHGDLAGNAHMTLPVLQALIQRYQLTNRRGTDAGARNWTSFEQRMQTITSLFRLRQRQQTLFADPFDPGETARLLSGGGNGG